jgi:hypothetical protein
MELVFSREIFENCAYIKSHENVSSGSRVVALEQTDMKKLVVAFITFANAPQNKISHCNDRYEPEHGNKTNFIKFCIGN